MLRVLMKSILAINQEVDVDHWQQKEKYIYNEKEIY